MGQQDGSEVKALAVNTNEFDPRTHGGREGPTLASCPLTSPTPHTCAQVSVKGQKSCVIHACVACVEARLIAESLQLPYLILRQGIFSKARACCFR